MIEKYERIYVCVDDTDDLTKSTSTGSIADAIGAAIEEEFGVRVNTGITRHQLFLDESVPYTSHNSSMCFDVMLPEGAAARVDEIGWEKINAMRAESANPGLCILTAPGPMADARIKMAYAALIRYGWEAKERYIDPEEAVQMAENYPEIILKWDGETGQGRVGALAGIGLRMSGNDGRFRGRFHFESLVGRPETSADECRRICQEKEGHTPVFTDTDGRALGPDEVLKLHNDVKPVLRNGQMTILCGRDGDKWKPFSKDDLPSDNPMKKGGKNKKKKDCQHFELDPDEEERFNRKQRRSCGSCLYRRLTDDGYICSQGYEC